MLLALWTLAAALGQVVSWMGPGLRDGSGNVPAYDGSAAASGSLVAVLAAVAFVSLLRGRVRVALVAVVVPAALAIAFAWAPVLLAVVVVVSLVGLVAALVLAMVTGEVRPAVALVNRRRQGPGPERPA
jgi:O-antigen ligase